MDAIDAVKTAAAVSGTPITHIGPAMGKGRNYVSAIALRGSSPQCNTAAAMLAACGYSLVVVPSDSVPAGALVIDPPAR